MKNYLFNFFFLVAITAPKPTPKAPTPANPLELVEDVFGSSFFSIFGVSPLLWLLDLLAKLSNRSLPFGVLSSFNPFNKSLLSFLMSSFVSVSLSFNSSFNFSLLFSWALTTHLFSVLLILF